MVRDGVQDGDIRVGSGQAEPRTSDDLPLGTSVGEHFVGGLIARGGCGSVYHGTHQTRGGQVAVKVLHAGLAAQPKMVERFVREVDVVNLLRHPSIVEIHEIGVLPSLRPFYVMELLEGGTLEDLLRRKDRLSPEEALEILEPVCAALEAVHAAGVIHRDVKASNIAFTSGRRTVKLLDFGIAKLVSPAPGHAGLTTVGRQLGTPAIMAPEQLLGAPVDARVDVYALGVLAYRLLTGRPPFQAQSAAALVRKHLEEPPPRPSRIAKIPPALDAVLLRCLEKRPERRFDTARAFATALARAIGRPTGGPQSMPRAPVTATAIYLEVRLRTADDQLDGALSRDVGGLLDLAEAWLLREGLLLASVTGSGILGVRLAAPGGGDPSTARGEAIALATSLHDEIVQRSGADPRVHVNLTLHAGEVLLRGSDPPEILGGPLLRTSTWAPRADVAYVSITEAAAEGLQGLDPRITILRPAASG